LADFIFRYSNPDKPEITNRKLQTISNDQKSKFQTKGVILNAHSGLFRSLKIEIWDLFEIWYLKFVIFNTLLSFLIKLAAPRASGWADT